MRMYSILFSVGFTFISVFKCVPNSHTQVLAHNLSPQMLGDKRYGVLVPLTYRQLHPDATNEQMDKAHMLGKTTLHAD